MPGTLSYAAEMDGLAYLFPDADCEVKLSTTTVNPDGTGLSEPVGTTWYIVKDLPFGAPTGQGPTEKSNNVDIDYGKADAGDPEVRLKGYMVFEKTGSKMRSAVNFPSDIVVQPNNPVKFEAGTLVVSLN